MEGMSQAKPGDPIGDRRSLRAYPTADRLANLVRAMASPADIRGRCIVWKLLHNDRAPSSLLANNPFPIHHLIRPRTLTAISLRRW